MFFVELYGTLRLLASVTVPLLSSVITESLLALPSIEHPSKTTVYVTLLTLRWLPPIDCDVIYAFMLMLQEVTYFGARASRHVSGGAHM